MNNLRTAFPEKPNDELKKISKEFYHNLIDTFIETIKLFSISKEELNRRCSANFEFLHEIYKSGRNVQLNSGHFFNWEFANLYTSFHLRYQFIGVYMPIANKTFNRLFLKLRSRFGSVLIPATRFRSVFHKYLNIKYALALIADQNAGNTALAYWTPFFGKMVPFVKGPEKTARAMNTCIITTNFYKIKRGYYRIEFSLLTCEPRNLNDGEITKMLITFIENCIREHPANYLWSHRRWKHQYDEEKHGHLVI